ncbi:hypothetical protein F5Y09DRAFT_345007 [Xylaria sp. FL1042]|nr:hypothetical protein F5Y09DRAFT_345007 [Xylaria sp. FL1042]
MAAAISSWIYSVGFSRFYLETKDMCYEATPEGVYGHTGQTTIETFWQTIPTGYGPASGGNVSKIEFPHGLEPLRIVGESDLQGIMQSEAFNVEKCQLLWYV